MKTVIISDTHLKFHQTPEDIKRTEKVCRFLKSLQNNTDLLIINGDFFDLWAAWKHVIIKEYFPVLVILKNLTDSGTKIVMTAGNHDFWFKDFLVNYLHIKVYRNNCIMDIDGSRFFISHGDRFTSNDLRYQIFRRIIRNRFIQFIFSLFHPDFALQTGIKMSRSSRNRKITDKRREVMIKSLRKTAQKLLHDFDYVIFGHSHIPALEQFANGCYANSGDWVSHSTYLIFEDNKLKIKEFI